MMPSLAADPIAEALLEDIGPGDVTCQFFVDPEQAGAARIFAKQDSVVAGVETAAEVFTRVDQTLCVNALISSGTRVCPGNTVLEIQGSVSSILSAERVALNFLQRLSGVATVTRLFVDAIAHTKTRILDTRKTTPGLRLLEKAAVKAGGGTNHRIGLYDMVMVKDNHLAARHDPDFLRNAIQRVRRERPDLRIELEADTLDQVRQFLAVGSVDVILLDNMSCPQMAEAVRMGNGAVQFEASGGVSMERVVDIAETGVDFISIGVLTHSAPAIDFSLELL